MKAITWFCCLALASAAYAIDDRSIQTKDVDVQEANGQAVIVTVTTDDTGAATKDVRVIQLGADDLPAAGDDGKPHVAFVRAIAEDEDAGTHDVHLFSNVTVSGDPNRGWLGVALGHTIEKDGEKDGAADDQGVVVLNVVKDSPAAQAGLLKDDVITAINGEPATDVVALSKSIGAIGAGGEARISVLRDGEPVELVATLSAPKNGGIEWLHSPDFTIREKLHTSPHLGMLTPGGNFSFLDLDNLDDLEDADAIHKALADFVARGGATFQMSMHDGKRVVEIRNDDNGDVVVIHQDGDGPITVKRSTEGSDDGTENEYADADALAAADPEAYELYETHADRSSGFWINKDGNNFTFNNDPDADAFSWFGEDENGEPLSQEALERLHESLMNAFDGSAVHFRAGAGGGFFGKAAHSFRVTPDGQIELTVRKGDSEVVRVFTDEADLEARDPAEFERYQEVMNADVEQK